MEYTIIRYIHTHADISSFTSQLRNSEPITEPKGSENSHRLVPEAELQLLLL